MRCLAAATAFAAALLAPRALDAQWSRTYEQAYLPGEFNFTFRREYPAADRLFNAFDYGHAILYERLLTEPGADPARLERDEYDYITRELLVRPPALPLEESAIEVRYARLVPEAKQMFDWAHLLHRQIYDVLASEELSQAEKDAAIARLVAYYRTRPDLAFSSVPKNMTLMEGQPYSLVFRRRYPKFNGLIWGYHWLQVGLYEPLMTARDREERQTGVLAAVARFRQMLENAPERMPRVMPMTAAIAPKFSARYEEAAIIFDNLHAMHDVVSDILANDAVPRSAKRATILEAAARYRDDTSFAMPLAEWRAMGPMMGVANMGGPAVGVLAGWETPTIARGATMEEAMRGMGHGAHAAADTAKAAGAAANPHAGHDMGATPTPPAARPDSSAAHHAMPGMTHDAAAHPRAPVAKAPATPMAKKPAAKKPAPKKPAAKKPAAKPAKKPPAPIDHSKHTMPMPMPVPVPETARQ